MADHQDEHYKNAVMDPVHDPVVARAYPPFTIATQHAEGDQMFVLDDVAIIVEDKTVAVAPSTRAGDTRRLRNDLTHTIRRAVDQATRLQERIESDGGLRLHGKGWMDMSSF